MKHSLSIFLLVVAGLWNAVLPATAAPASVYPLHPSANRRYMLDASNAPFLIIGDAPHSILANLSNSDAVTYLTDRGQRGFNALWIELLCNSYTFGYGNEGDPNYGRDVNGNNPFTSTLGGGFYDLTTPNEAYWSHVDYIVQQAAANGLQCMFTPLDQGGWTQTSLVNGTTRCRQYGQFLGNRYMNYPNIIWNFGNDFQQWRTQQNDAVILAIADGLRSADSNHLITIQLDYFVSESQDDPNWIPRINTNGVYTYYPTYAETLVAYNKPTIMPVLFLEENYEDENNVGELGTPKVLRRQEYWSMGGGALAGHMYGSYWTDRFANGWQSHLNTQAVTELGYFKNFFNSIHWYDLVPDQLHTFLTAGYGTFNDRGHVGDNDYATGMRRQDGTLGVVYTPVSHTLTIAMSSFAGPVTARWYDPTNATFQTVPGSPFPNNGSHNFTTPGNNNAGDPDWVLLLQVPPVVTTNPATYVASNSVTLNGSVNPSGLTTTVYFQYGTTTNYGHTTPVKTRSGNIFHPINASVSGLNPSTTYHFRIVAHNNNGTRFGSDRTFTTRSPTGPPVVATTAATNVASFSATLNGSVYPHRLTTTVYFQYGTTTSYGLTTTPQSHNGNTYRNIAANISGLTPNTVYHFRIVATNSAGTRFGGDRAFTTLAATGPPVVTTDPASFIASFSARLNALLNPHGLATSVHFQYGTTPSYGLATAPQTRTGNAFQVVGANVSGLTANTLYHFRVVASNAAGTTMGSDRTFTTLTATGPPVVTTNLATNRTTSSASLHGSLDPHGFTTTVYFQWGTTTSYGHTTPMQSQTGNTYRNIAANIGGLATHTTYHFRIVATNSGGTRYGSDRTFSTL